MLKNISIQASIFLFVSSVLKSRKELNIKNEEANNNIVYHVMVFVEQNKPQ
jgi:hypothetical protein